MTEMTEERLAEIARVLKVELGKAAMLRVELHPAWRMAQDSIAEIDRLRAELAAKDAEIAARNVALELIANHDQYGWYGDVARRALNPEPAPCPHGRMARTECWQCDGTPDPEPVPCEASGCESPATTHDADGMLLCRECGEELVASGEPAP